jgi:hypothetical protein
MYQSLNQREQSGGQQAFSWDQISFEDLPEFGARSSSSSSTGGGSQRSQQQHREQQRVEDLQGQTPSQEVLKSLLSDVPSTSHIDVSSYASGKTVSFVSDVEHS